MPRTARASVADYCYHVLNRGNGRAEVFHKEADYAAFHAMIAQACARLPMRVYGYCLMPNHFHFVLRPLADGDLSRWMQWLMTTHVRRYRRHYGSSGHVWEGRFKAFPCQDDDHLITVLRYVERNPLRAGLVTKAQQWPWCSLHSAKSQDSQLRIEPGPLPRDAAWVARVNRPMSEPELEAMRLCIARGRPFGSDEWANQTALKLGLESTMRPRGRPIGSKKK
jgi:REP-associated tyrosine transposase